MVDEKGESDSPMVFEQFNGGPVRLSLASCGVSVI